MVYAFKYQCLYKALTGIWNDAQALIERLERSVSYRWAVAKWRLYDDGIKAARRAMRSADNAKFALRSGNYAAAKRALAKTVEHFDAAREAEKGLKRRRSKKVSKRR